MESGGLSSCTSWDKWGSTAHGDVGGEEAKVVIDMASAIKATSFNSLLSAVYYTFNV